MPPADDPLAGSAGAPAADERSQHGAKCAVSLTAHSLTAHQDQRGLTLASVNQNPDLKDLDMQIKNYGEYAVVLSAAQSIFARLNRFFSTGDSQLICTLGIFFFVNEGAPAKSVQDIFEQSFLSEMWPDLTLSESDIVRFLRLLAQHPAVCESYEQSLINEASEQIALVSQTLSPCAKAGSPSVTLNKYSASDSRRIKVTELVDTKTETLLSCRIYAGYITDRISSADLLDAYSFQSGTVLLAEAGFYAEAVLALFRRDSRHFVIAVPDSSVISQARHRNSPPAKSFISSAADEAGSKCSRRIWLTESAVSEFEAECRKFAGCNDANLNRAVPEDAAAEEANLKRSRSGETSESAFNTDRIIMYRDGEKPDRAAAEFSDETGSADFHDDAGLRNPPPQSGSIVLRTNLARQDSSAQDVYENYMLHLKQAAQISQFSMAASIIRCSGLKTDDYYVLQGLSFILLVTAGIKAAFKRKQTGTGSGCVSQLSVRACLAKAARIKLCQHQDQRWHLPVTAPEVAELMSAMGADLAGDLRRLNAGQTAGEISSIY